MYNVWGENKIFKLDKGDIYAHKSQNSIMQPFRNEESSFQFSSYCVSLYNNIIYINSDRKLRYVRNFTTVRDRVPVFAEFLNFTYKNKIGFLTAKENPS